MISTTKTYLLNLSVFLSSFLYANEAVTVQGHSYPIRISAHDVEWKLAGTEHFKYKVFFSVFTAAYYRQVDGGGEKLIFTYTRDLKAADLSKQSMNHLEETNDPTTLATYKELTDKIQAAYVNVQENDSYAVTSVPGKGTWLHLNEQEVFFSENAEFGDWYLSIWLGDPPISESLKQALVKEESS